MCDRGDRDGDVTEFHLADEHHVRVVFHFFFVVFGGQGLGSGVFLFLENSIFRYFGIRVLLTVKNVGELRRAQFAEKEWKKLVSLSGVTIERSFFEVKDKDRLLRHIVFSVD